MLERFLVAHGHVPAVLHQVDLKLDEVDEVRGECVLAFEALRYPAQGLAELLVRQVIVLAFDPQPELLT